ncbi:outer membrane protein [Sulfurimicrobium lacus]|uniref:Outer membrane protein n=1 Tax=Sulfurimicrobium lacus TaxID=2715678 RepID=A0A6F8VCJ4_9PROT|nr:TolC family outer membrane protein [Sulfurimicrobium lacus]BCB26861.1 outer membrane protein [Sulfurimicrobium lacus]
MKRVILTFLISSTLAPTSQAADTTNLMSVYRQALACDAVFASASASYQAAREKLPQGLAQLLPNVNLSASTTWNGLDVSYSGATSLPSGKRDYNSNAYTVSLNQPLYRIQNWKQYEIAKVQVGQAEMQLALAQQDLMLRVAQAYFDVLLAQANATLAAAQKQAIKEQLAQARRNFEVGTATITDTHEAQARHDLAEAAEIAASNELEVRKRALERIIGKAPGPLAGVEENFPLLLPEPNDMNQWVKTAEQQSLPVQIQRATSEIAKREVERNRGAHQPTLDLVASYSDGSASGSLYGVASDTRASAIGVQLNFPLYQGGSVNSRVREAVANQEKANHDLEQTLRQAEYATREAFLGVASGMAQVKAYKQARISSQSSLDSSRLGMEVGVRTFVDVLNAQQQLFSTSRDLNKAVYDYLLSRLKLKQASGSLSEEDLQQLNLLLK